MHAAIAALLATLTLGATPQLPTDTLVVCPESFVPALRPWLDYRSAQGRQIGLITETESKERIRAAIRETAKTGALRWVVLVGDVPGEQPTPESPGVPTHLMDAVVNVHFGSEPTLVTDNYYADIDDDLIPDVAVGRLSVRTPEQLETVVAKILAYEQDVSPGAWRRQLNVVAGVGGFGILADTLMESITKKFLTDEVPSSFETKVAYASWHSPYCPDPREFQDETVNQLNDGCLFWIYIGHGQRRYLDYISVPKQRYYPIFQASDVGRLQCKNGSPIAIFLACYTGAFDEPNDCLAEEMLRREGGPVAVYAGSRVTMPYAMSVMGSEMLEEYFQNNRETLGELILYAKRDMVEASSKGGNRKLLDSLARLVSPKPELLKDERREHVQLFNLIGDPLLRLPRAESAQVASATEARAGESLVVSGISPVAGKGRLEVVCRRDLLTFKPETRTDYEASLPEFPNVYRQANDRCWESVELDLPAGPFETTIPLPAHCSGECHVRLFVEGADVCALGSCDVKVAPAEGNVQAP
ncbi:C25 family cysteine peptidase [Blastopirellula sp. JC732]|uniref:C25 family cysteine peptidase n=1 Tax=Blastopirellula sediminis TaxID=2894196 RepID=A0A9X1SFK0_9BACT|nr:C25 family cysteine peptidase [Blastopirellula sediminis]MCC9609628.1 C25 family cysteine peptidase [Blastopirellula sediminis]MCC9627596.1 C25 family cysteine peptidase [Blastopirellula sediminis]